MKKKNVFVTGGGGFIGSHLVEKLVNLGHNVKTLVPYTVDNSWGWIDTFSKEIKKNSGYNRRCLRWKFDDQ